MSSPFERPAPARLPPLPRYFRRIVLWILAAVFLGMVVIRWLARFFIAWLLCSAFQPRPLGVPPPVALDRRCARHPDHPDLPFAAGDDGDVLVAQRHHAAAPPGSRQTAGGKAPWGIACSLVRAACGETLDRRHREASVLDSGTADRRELHRCARGIVG